MEEGEQELQNTFRSSLLAFHVAAQIIPALQTDMVKSLYFINLIKTLKYHIFMSNQIFY